MGGFDFLTLYKKKQVLRSDSETIVFLKNRISIMEKHFKVLFFSLYCNDCVKLITNLNETQIFENENLFVMIIGDKYETGIMKTRILTKRDIFNISYKEINELGISSVPYLLTVEDEKLNRFEENQIINEVFNLRR